MHPRVNSPLWLDNDGVTVEVSGPTGWEDHKDWTAAWFEVVVAQADADGDGIVYAYAADAERVYRPGQKTWWLTAKFTDDADKPGPPLREGRASAFGIAWVTANGSTQSKPWPWANYELDLRVKPATVAPPHDT